MLERLFAGSTLHDVVSVLRQALGRHFSERQLVFDEQKMYFFFQSFTGAPVF